MSAPTLFDELKTTTARLGITDKARLVPEDERILDIWADHGIPADLSTVEHACHLLMVLWAETKQTRLLLTELAAPVAPLPEETPE